ncbi:MAG: hypothetical protein HQK50_10855 [Oligoflexia bacterium]|nr:hypothetical protein [Oligoflexia bacterium]MBF0366061.1 hypothetical protein [Oligoflexia bacterium]
MLYKNSNDPIEMKKISLRIFSMRSYLEAFIKGYVKNIEVDDLSIQELNALFNQYYQDTYLIEHFPHVIQDKTVLPAVKENPEENKNNKEGNKGNNNEDGPIQMSFGIPIHPLIPEEKTAYGKTFISDINIANIGLFSTKPYLIGQNIIIEFDLPHTFSVGAEVLSCKNFNIHSRIISTNRPPFRIHASFVFTRKGERTLLRNFIESMEPDRPNKKSADQAADPAAAA